MSEWISVKDRLPENGDEVLIYIGLGDRPHQWWQYMATIYRDGFHATARSSVTHWMPLPDAPRGE